MRTVRGVAAWFAASPRAQAATGATLGAALGVAMLARYGVAWVAALPGLVLHLL